MVKERKIKKIVRKLTFAEAEEADDEYWANATTKERLQELLRLRKMVYGELINQRIEKVVFKGSIHEIEN